MSMERRVRRQNLRERVAELEARLQAVLAQNAPQVREKGIPTQPLPDEPKDLGFSWKITSTKLPTSPESKLDGYN